MQRHGDPHRKLRTMLIRAKGHAKTENPTVAETRRHYPDGMKNVAPCDAYRGPSSRKAC